MSDEITVPIEGTEAVNKSDFTPITNQDELNKAIAARLERERSKFADYNDLKTKASKFDELAEAQKSETQKALDRAEAAERALAEKSSEALRMSVLAKFSIPEAYQEFVTGADEEELTAKAVKVLSLIPTEPVEQSPLRELYVAGEGRSPATALNSDALLESLKKAVGAK